MAILHGTLGCLTQEGGAIARYRRALECRGLPLLFLKADSEDPILTIRTALKK